MEQEKQIFRAIDTRFYWVRDRIRQNNFNIFWREGKKKLPDYVTKYHPIRKHRIMRPRYLKATKRSLKTQKTGKLGTEEGMLELSIWGEPGNMIILLRESGIQFAVTYIILLSKPVI